MADEIFDTVDECDRVIGRMSRRDVHRFGLRHRAAHILVFDRDRRLFLQRRSPLKECAPGLWDSSAAGHVESGESYLECAVRELHEELGLHASELPVPVLRLDAGVENGWEFVWVFRCQAEGELRLDPAEIAEGRWFTREALGAWLAEYPERCTGTLRLVWTQLKECWDRGDPDPRFETQPPVHPRGPVVGGLESGRGDCIRPRA